MFHLGWLCCCILVFFYFCETFFIPRVFVSSRLCVFWSAREGPRIFLFLVLAFLSFIFGPRVFVFVFVGPRVFGGELIFLLCGGL